MVKEWIKSSLWSVVGKALEIAIHCTVETVSHAIVIGSYVADVGRIIFGGIGVRVVELDVQNEATTLGLGRAGVLLEPFGLEEELFEEMVRNEYAWPVWVEDRSSRVQVVSPLTHSFEMVPSVASSAAVCFVMVYGGGASAAVSLEAYRDRDCRSLSQCCHRCWRRSQSSEDWRRGRR